MLELFCRSWYLWLLIMLALIYRMLKPTIKGWIGEKTVSVYLSKLPKEEYSLLSDLIISTENGTTQIDHVVVSIYGIFVIEVKNYKGWIYGNEKSAQWTQNIYGKKHKFMNPLHQNYAHTKALEALLNQFENVTIVPIVAFSANCDLKVNTTSHVVYFHRICSAIRGYQDKVLESHNVAAIVNLLKNKNTRSSTVKKEHIEMIAARKTEIENAVVGSKCPKCSGTLVERKGKFGTFVGCSNYPNCRFIKNGTERNI